MEGEHLHPSWPSSLNMHTYTNPVTHSDLCMYAHTQSYKKKTKILPKFIVFQRFGSKKAHALAHEHTNANISDTYACS